MNQGGFSLDLFSADGLFEWMRMIEPVWTVSIVIAVNYLFKKGLSRTKMSFPDFYIQRSSGFWLDLIIAVSVLSVVLTIYYKHELMLSFDGQPIDYLLSQGFENLKTSLSSLFSSWISYIVMSLPILALILIEVRERKRNGFKLKLPIWKLFLATLLLSFIVYWTFNNLMNMFGELVMNLIYAPFEMIEIPIILGVIVSVLFKTVNFMVLAAVVHFGIRSGMMKDPNAAVNMNNTNDILDK